MLKHSSSTAAPELRRQRPRWKRESRGYDNMNTIMEEQEERVCGCREEADVRSHHGVSLDDKQHDGARLRRFGSVSNESGSLRVLLSAKYQAAQSRAPRHDWPIQV